MKKGLLADALARRYGKRLRKKTTSFTHTSKATSSNTAPNTGHSHNVAVTGNAVTGHPPKLDVNTSSHSEHQDIKQTKESSAPKATKSRESLLAVMKANLKKRNTEATNLVIGEKASVVSGNLIGETGTIVDINYIDITVQIKFDGNTDPVWMDQTSVI